MWQSNEHIKMKFDILKCDVVSLQRGEETRWKVIQLPNVEEIGEKDVGGYKYLGVLERDITMCEEMIRKVKEVYQKRITLLIKTHLNVKILFLALNTWAISVKDIVLLSWIGQKRIQKNLIVGLENS